jgi:cytidylate kinase
MEFIMNVRSSSQLLAEAMVHAGSYRESVHQGQGPQPVATSKFTIAFSREAGARGTTIGSEVGARLHWPVYDQELLEKIAREMNTRARLLESVDEKRQSWLEECVEAFASVPLVSQSAFVRHMIETVLSLGAIGSCVIVGRGAVHILPPATTLRVRLVGEQEDRIEVMAGQLGVSREEAARRIATIERERLAFLKDHFQIDAADPHRYDLVLNTSRFTVVECADLIVEGFKRMEARAGE